MRIQIESPCSKNWNNMTFNDQGRFCDSCQKTVIDFRNLSDNEIIEYIKITNAKTCGNLSQSQLNRVLAKPISRTKRLFSVLGSLLISLGIINQAKAESNSTDISITNQQFVNNSESITSTDSVRIVKGTVVDETDETPLPGAFVTIIGTNITIQTDLNGFFSLYIPSNISLRSMIEFKSLGYQTRRIRLSKLIKSEKKTIKIKLDAQMLGEIALVD
ncbi:carboxypeptidase-like regulatory domain-containing protein [Solitalea sp. MAHUQ-68]|uniref:Carboxypeptidase-like regulatory domain-containing protein n=1 Tax=Solitalea agri TaxID=2953739 RepID=A0A9X2F7P9_9SPHI|nr:carboxypeptidase-like regulatory domain-containing protein [Solitalea agri]MCO4293896.1 carboxypeptidase-like regulatory domain-containing protein [Solitalea agri]